MLTVSRRPTNKRQPIGLSDLQSSNMPLIAIDTNVPFSKPNTDLVNELKEYASKLWSAPLENMLVVVRYGQGVSFGRRTGPVAYVKAMSLINSNGTIINILLMLIMV